MMSDNQRNWIATQRGLGGKHAKPPIFLLAYEGVTENTRGADTSI
jgi:hypothetical protein